MKNEERPLSGYRVDNNPNEPNVFVFETNKSIVYEVRFKPSGYIFENDPELEPFVFEMSIAVLENPTGKRPPGDPLVPPTIASIFGIFFEQHNRVVVYICDTSDQRGRVRQRKFLSWFNLYKGGNYTQFNDSIIDETGDLYFVSLIIRHTNPYRLRLMMAFNDLMVYSREGK